MVDTGNGVVNRFLLLPPFTETLAIACTGQEVSRELLNWVMVVEYMDRAQGPTMAFFA